MRELRVQSLPLHEVIRDLSEEFQCRYTEDCGEYLIELPSEVGMGYIRGIDFGRGFGLIEYFCRFNETVKIHFSLSKVHPLKFIFCSFGKVLHTFEELESVNSIHKYQNILVASSNHNGHVLQFEANKRIHLNSLEIDRKRFVKEFSCNLSELEHPLKPLFKDESGNKLFFYQGNYSLRTADIIIQMNSGDYEGFLRTIRLESSALEMLAVQIEQYEDDLKLRNNQTVIRRRDIDQIKKAVQRIKESLAEPITIKSLSQELGMNPNKLQNGFKYLYRDTVNNFIQQLRLEKAQDLLLHSDLNISEITSSVGLANPSYLSRMFRKKYGITPREFRKGIVPMEK